MADRTRTPDILGNVLSAPESTSADVEAPPPVKKAAKRKTVKQQDGKTVNSQDNLSQTDVEKIKATFYLAPEAVEGLEDAWLQLRRQARGVSRKRAISKSEIVEIALQMMLEDLDAHGKSSQISSKLLNA